MAGKDETDDQKERDAKGQQDDEGTLEGASDLGNAYCFEIEVDPRYIEKESRPETDRFVFAYTITIKNVGSEPATLRHRFWIVTNAEGSRQEVRGRGVVGEEPRIEPGEGFRYTSAAVIETPVGAMEGTYEFETDDGKCFDVPIPAFSLSMPNVVH